MQEILEAAALFADPVRGRHRQAVDEQLVGVDCLAAHFRDLAHLDVTAIERRIEQAETVGGFAAAAERRRARQEQHFVSDLRGGNPNLCAADDINVAAALRPRFNLAGLEPGIGLGHRETGFFLARCDRRQHAALLLLAAVN